MLMSRILRCRLRLPGSIRAVELEDLELTRVWCSFETSGKRLHRKSHQKEGQHMGSRLN